WNPVAVALTAGTPGAGGISGGAGTNSAPPGGGGSSHARSTGSGFVSRTAPEPPAYALVNGSKVTMEIECSTACRGGATLRHRASATAKSFKILTRFRFGLSAKGAMAVTGQLTPAG